MLPAVNLLPYARTGASLPPFGRGAGKTTNLNLPPAILIIVLRHDGVFWIAAAACLGVYLFYRGFRLLERKRLILNTPTSTIRAASIGLVEVNGLAAGPATITAPVTGVPCYYCRTIGWQLRQSGKNKKWEKVAEEIQYVPFYIDDNTGRLLVNPQDAEMDIHEDFKETYKPSLLSFNADVPANVAKFLGRNGVDLDKNLKIEEYCIKPKNALFVLGTLATNPGLSVPAKPTPQFVEKNVHTFTVKIPGLTAVAPQLLSKKAAAQGGTQGTQVAEVIRLSAGSTVQSSSTMTQQEKIAAALIKAGVTNPAAWAVAGVNSGKLPDSSPRDSVGAVSAKASEEFDLNPATVLMRGEHNPTFLISWRSQRDLVHNLSWKSALMIWGGPTLTLACIYILATQFGWV